MENSVLTIIKNNKTNYHICYSKDADECTRYSATELQKYLYKASKVCIPLFSDKCEKRGPEIFIGNTRNINCSDLLVNLSDEGFLIKVIDNDLIILGKSPRATMYGVYYFLNKYISFRCLSNDTEIYQDIKKLEVGNNSEIKDFSFEHRDVYWNFAFDGNYASKNMLNSNLADLSNRKGGRRKWFNFHHSFSDLVNQDKYFDSHPEYFALIDGVRRKDHAELCLSNDDVFKIALNQVREWIKNNPDCKVFSVAQDEWMGHFEKMACECEKCKKIDDENESQSGSIITFVNRIAREIKKEYPDVLIHTFAYQFSRKPPKKCIPDDNVIVRLTNIECSWNKSIEEGAMEDPNGRNASFLNDLVNWSKICKRLYIWDYAVNYHNYLLPFPCFRSMYKNIQLYKKLGVKGLLMEGNFSLGGGGYFDELKAYLTSRLMGFDERKLEDIVSEFCDGYYGKASKKAQEYLYLFEDNIVSNLWLYDDADHPMFTDELCKKAKLIVKQMLSKVNNDDKEYTHVRTLALSCKYLELVRMDSEADKSLFENRINDFFKEVSKLGITELFERTSIDFSKEVIKKSRYAKNRETGIHYII